MESCIRAPERVLQEEQVGNRLLPAIHVGKKDTTLSQLPKTCFLWVSSPPGSLSVYQQALSTLPWSCILNPCVSARLSRWRKGKESACRYRRHTDAGSIPRWGRSPGGGNGNPPPSTLAWRIPWTEEPGGLQSLRSQRVRHDWTGTGPLPPVCHHSRPDSNHMLLSNATDAQLGSLSLPMAPSSVFFIWWLKI